MPILYVGAQAGVQFINNSGGSTGSRTVTAGNFLAAASVSGSTASTITHTLAGTVNFPTGLSEIQAVGGDFCRLGYVENCAGGTEAFTLGTAGGTYSSLQWAEWSGLAASASLDKVASATGNSTALASGSTATTTTNDQLILGFGTVLGGSSMTWTAGTNFTIRSSTNRADLGAVGFLEDRIVSSTGAYAASATSSISGQWVIGVVTFKAANPGGATGTATPTLGRLTSAASGTVINPLGVNYIKEVGFVTNTTASGTADTITVAAGGVPVGDHVVVLGSCDNTGSSGVATTIAGSDTRGNTYTLQTAQAIADPGAASAGIQGFALICKVGTALQAGDVITITYGNATTAKAISAQHLTGVHPTTAVLSGTYSTQDNQTGQSVSLAATPTASGQMVIAIVAVEGGTADTYTEDADSTNGTWTSFTRRGSGTTTSGATLNAAYKRVTASGAQSYGTATSLGTSRDHAGLIFVLDFNPQNRTGTVTPTLGRLTSAISGTVSTNNNRTGTVTPTLGGLTSAASGTVRNPATVAVTLGRMTSAASGTVANPNRTGTVAQTLSRMTSTASGTVVNPVVGTVARTLGRMTSAASGTVANPNRTGTVTPTLGRLTSAASGTVRNPATVAVTLGRLTSAASGTVVNPAITGTVARTLGRLTSAASGTVRNPATVAVTLGRLTSAASGTVVNPNRTGTVARTLGRLTSAASGTVANPNRTGTVAQSLGRMTSVASGTVLNPNTGTVARTLGRMTSAASGTVVNPNRTGTVSATLGRLTSAASGTVRNPATVARTLGRLTSAISGTVNNPAGSGTASATLGRLTSAVSGTVRNPATVARTLNRMTSAASGTVANPNRTGTVIQTLGRMTSAVSGTVVNPVTGTVARTLGRVTSAASGTVANPNRTGTVARTLNRVTSAASGTVANPNRTGTVAPTLNRMTAAASGTVVNPVVVRTPPTGHLAAIGVAGRAGVLGGDGQGLVLGNDGRSMPA